jgi:putative ABC transport system permease protein
MLMSVTERFREIATLKCLGALDAFIMSVFLIEAGLLGFFGGVGGAVAGLLLAGARMAVTFQDLMWTAFPLTDVLIAGLLSIGVGMVLAAVSAVYPSLRAARLAPMEAMRIE